MALQYGWKMRLCIRDIHVRHMHITAQLKSNISTSIHQ